MSGEPTPVCLEVEDGLAHLVLDAPERSVRAVSRTSAGRGQAREHPYPADCLVGGIGREVADRLLFAVSIEVGAALPDGTATSAAEANVLSIDAIGFPTVLGGAIGHVLRHVRDPHAHGP